MLDGSVTTGELDDMASAGVRGIRLNLETTADTDIDKAKRTLDAVAKRLHGRDWHLASFAKPQIVGRYWMHSGQRSVLGPNGSAANDP
jgi:hypothetical protein